MWEGLFDDKMRNLFIEYEKMFGDDPDTYEEEARHGKAFEGLLNHYFGK